MTIEPQRQKTPFLKEKPSLLVNVELVKIIHPIASLSIDHLMQWGYEMLRSCSIQK